jgi:predicted TIM-barrel fold metal-dependent hydrolase
MLYLRLCGLVLLTSLLVAGEPLSEAMLNLKLKDYRPVSIYNVPKTVVLKAKYPAIDVHTHDYAKTTEEVDAWVATMDAANIAKSIILTFATGADFDALVAKYSRYPDRFELWCYFDFTNTDAPDWSARAVAELVRCHQMGARGVGELMDKGMGFRPILTTATIKALTENQVGMHINDPRMKPLLEKCAELHMPINIHVAEDAWMYLPADAANDGLMNGAKWKVDLSRNGIADHDQLITTLAEAVRDHPKTTFIACHLANCCADLSQLGKLFDAYPNLYADIAARYGEIAPIPRYVHAFMEKYSTRLLYGTDNRFQNGIHAVSFRILETADEHFYEIDRFGYHWPLHGLNLSDDTLANLYYRNRLRLMEQR